MAADPKAVEKLDRIGIDTVRDLLSIGRTHTQIARQANVSYHSLVEWMAAHGALDTLPSRKPCLSCGAVTDPYGNLPCGH